MYIADFYNITFLKAIQDRKFDRFVEEVLLVKTAPTVALI